MLDGQKKEADKETLLGVLPTRNVWGKIIGIRNIAKDILGYST